MNRSHKRTDPVFIAILLVSAVVGVFAVRSEIIERRAPAAIGGPRKIDIEEVRRQMSDGTLSEKKALFFRNVTK